MGEFTIKIIVLNKTAVQVETFYVSASWYWYLVLLSVFESLNQFQTYLPDNGAPCIITARPLLFLAAFPSGVRSMQRCLAIAADTGVISSSPTPGPLAIDSFIFSEKQNVNCHINKNYSITFTFIPSHFYFQPNYDLIHDILNKTIDFSCIISG